MSMGRCQQQLVDPFKTGNFSHSSWKRRIPIFRKYHENPSKHAIFLWDFHIILSEKAKVNVLAERAARGRATASGDRDLVDSCLGIAFLNANHANHLKLNVPNQIASSVSHLRNRATGSWPRRLSTRLELPHFLDWKIERLVFFGDPSLDLYDLFNSNLG